MLLTSLASLTPRFTGTLLAALIAAIVAPLASQRSSTPMPEVPVCPAAFAESHLNLTLEPQQRAILTADPHRILVVGSRQWGKSLTAAVKALHVALSQPNSLTVIAAPSERQSSFVLNRAIRFAAPYNFKTRRVPGFTRSFEFPNGSRIVALPNNPDSVRGISDVNLLIFDEAAYINDKLYTDLRPTLMRANGDLWLLSTPAGQSGFFYDEYLDRAHWTYFKIPATDCPRLPKQFLDEERRKLGPATFDREYLCIFSSPKGSLFDLKAFETPERPEPNPSLRQPSTYYVGLDIGQKSTPSALVVIREVSTYSREIDRITGAYKLSTKFYLHHARLFPLNMQFSDLADEVEFFIDRLPRHSQEHVELICDATGLGAPVVEIFQKRSFRQATLRPVVITSGQDASYSNNSQKIPRDELLSAASILLAHPQFAIDPSAQGIHDLRNQLAASAPPDDLVFAFSLAAWYTRRRLD